MEKDRIAKSDITATGISVAVEPIGSHLWKISADLAEQIANDEDFQNAVKKAWMYWFGSEKTIEGLREVGSIARDKFGDQPHFDPHVELAAFRAVICLFAKKGLLPGSVEDFENNSEEKIVDAADYQNPYC